MTKVLFSSNTKKFQLAEFAVAKTGESESDAVKRSIARTTGHRVVSSGVLSWTEDKSGKRDSEVLNITLTEKTQRKITVDTPSWVNFE